MINCMINARITEFEYNSIGKWKKIVVKSKFEANELDEAFYFENGFTFSKFLKVCYNLILIGEKQKYEVKKFKCNKLAVRTIKRNRSNKNTENIRLYLLR